MFSAALWLASHPEVQGRLYLAWSEPEVIGPHARVLAAALAAAAPAGLRWQAVERPDLDHATIYRTLAPEVLPALYTDEREAFDLRVPHQPAPVTVEDRALLFYEIHMTNFSRQPLAPVSIDVLDADTGATVARYAGQELAGRLAPVAAGHGDVGAIAPGTAGVMYVELALDPDAMPSALRHRVGYRVNDDIGIRTTVAGGKVQINPDPPVVIRPPLRGGPWAAVFSPHWERGHRRVIYAVGGQATVPGRFAIDFVKLDAAGRVATDDADLIRNAHGYGEPVLAVADATVVAVRNDYPEAERISRNGRHPLSKGSGNYIMLELDSGHYAIYEHLRPGSVTVVPGQRVGRGDVIGEVGLSGSGAWPHLHLHLADKPSLLGGEGLPYAFDHFVVRGRYGDIADLGVRRWTDLEASPRYAERPAVNTVVEFPEK